MQTAFMVNRLVDCQFIGRQVPQSVSRVKFLEYFFTFYWPIYIDKLFLWLGATLRVGRPPASSKILMYDHFMKALVWLITDVTAYGSPIRAESVFGPFLIFFGRLEPLLWSGSHFMIWKPPLERQKPYLLRIIQSTILGSPAAVFLLEDCADRWQWEKN